MEPLLAAKQFRKGDLHDPVIVDRILFGLLRSHNKLVSMQHHLLVFYRHNTLANQQRNRLA